MTLTQLFIQIAQSIRVKTGSTTPIQAIQFPQEILKIESGGGSSFIKTIDVSEGVTILEEVNN